MQILDLYINPPTRSGEQLRILINEIIMQIINEAKECVCLPLLTQVSACERLLDAAEQKGNKIRTKDLFLKQHKLLNRLEKVITLNFLIK